MNFESVGVVGCGLMGHGIAQVAAQAGCQVVVCESDEAALQTGLTRIERSLAKMADKAVEKGAQTRDVADAAATAARGRISTTATVDGLSSCDLVIEAIVEDLEVKKTLFATLGEVCAPDAVLASNTSSFPIAEMAAVSGRADRTIGLHFFNPVQLMKLVEVVRTEDTADAVFETAMEFGRACGKHPVACGDTPGFIVNRLLVPYMTQAIEMLDRGDATKEDIDAAMQFGCGYPMGPITLADYVGLDTTLSILEGWSRRFPEEPVFRVPRSLREKVEAGTFGRKSGAGYYTWDGDKRS